MCELNIKTRIEASSRFRSLLLVFLVALAARPASAQTPAPLQEWQYSSGIALYKMYLPDALWQVDAGLAVEPRPLYEGSERYRTLVGPVLDVRYKDLAFLSAGEGIGVNVLRGANYRAGVAIGYDMGRIAHDDLEHLKGLGDVGTSATVKLFGSYVISKALPLVFRGDLRQYTGGASGLQGDLDIYMPLPGSSEHIVMFAGPSLTFADRAHLQTLFGVNPNQALASGYENYSAHGGLESAGFGFTANWMMSRHWLLVADLAANRLLGSAADSPITQTRVQGVAVLALAYKW
jgi:outer membrane scaffolding protein for murein synthesis (MipA/OmpV family)